MKYNKKTRTRTRRKKGGNGSRSPRRKRTTKNGLSPHVPVYKLDLEKWRGDEINDIRVIIEYEFDRIEEMLDTLTSIVKRIDSRMNRQSTARDGSIVTSHRVSPHVIPPDEG
jgi:hypothetical protein